MRKYRFHIMYDFIVNNNYKTFVEVGLGKGPTTGYILKNIKDKDFRMWGVDPFLEYFGRIGSDKKVYNKLYSKSVQGMNANERKVLLAIGGDKRYTLIRKMSSEAVKDFEPESIDIVFIDANHNYEYVLEDIDKWSKIVKSGGIVSGHDYFPNPKKSRAPGVKKAVDEYAKVHGIDFRRAADTVWYFYK